MLKIIITGPESSGKTTLATQLATHFAAPLVSEYARIFLEKRTPPQYNYADLLKIAKKQVTLEQQAASAQSPHTVIICDTDLITIKIWAQVVFKKCPTWILKQLDNTATSENRFYILCPPDGIEWEFDPLRENPHDRDFLFQLYENELKFYQKKYTILRGGKSERFSKALQKIETML